MHCAATNECRKDGWLRLNKLSALTLIQFGDREPYIRPIEPNKRHPLPYIRIRIRTRIIRIDLKAKCLLLFS